MTVKNGGAINIAIEKAGRYGASLVIKRNGKIERVSPEEIRNFGRVLSAITPKSVPKLGDWVPGFFRFWAVL